MRPFTFNVSPRSNAMRTAPLIVALCCALFGCGGGGGGAASTPSVVYQDPARTDSTINALIAPEITGYERALVYDTLASLRPQDRGDVRIFDDGRIYANSAGTRQAAFYYGATSDPNVFSEPDGSTVLLPDQRTTSAAGEGGGTGIAHSRYSDPGYSYMSADVFIPCADTQLNGATTLNGHAVPKQAGYIYGGGTSSLGNQADVGIQVNPPPGKLGVPTSVQMFINPGSQGFGAARAVGTLDHLYCDATYQLQTFVAEIGAGVYLVDVASTSGQRPQVMTQRVNSTATSGWSKTCPQCRTKRVTSLAVPANSTPQTVIGSWFGVISPYSSSPEGAVQWNNVQQSYFRSRGDFVPVAPIAWYEATSTDLPSDGQSRGFVIAQPTSSSDEAVGLNESGPRLQLK